MHVSLTMVTVVIIAAVQSKNVCSFLALLNFAANPVALPAEVDGVIDAFVGEEVVIKFYAAGIPPPEPGNLTWFYNSSSGINWGTFSEDKQSLIIPNVQLSHAGEYKFRILYYLTTKFLSDTATTTVNVIGKEGFV